MRRIGCLRFLFRTVTLIVGLVLVFGLGYLAVNGVRELSNRSALRRLQENQAASFPEIATKIAQDNAAIITPVLTITLTSSPLPTSDVTATTAPTTEQTATESTATASSTVESTATDNDSELVTNTVVATEAPTLFVAASEQVVALQPSDTLTATILPTETATLTVTHTPTDPPTATFTPTPTDTEIPPTSTATHTVTFTPTPTDEPTVVVVLPTNTRRAGPLPTNTKRPSLTPIPPTETPTITLTPEPATTTPTSIPTSEATVTLVEAAPTLQATNTLPVVIGRTDCTDKPQPTEVPPPAPRLKSNGNDIVNIMLVGSDADVIGETNGFHTDTLLIVSVNRTTNTVAMLSIPRDLYVCIPQLGMQRINVAFTWGESVGWSPGGGFGLLQETILYNMGIPIHYYARVSLTGFKEIVDTVGGVNIAVDCPIRDELIFTGEYNEMQTPVYTPHSLEVGYYHMDGRLALWYARSRKNTSDFDRNRRQQQVLRAIWREARAQGLIQKAPELWGQLTTIVTTNMQLTDVLGLMPIGLSLNPGDITGYYMFKGWQTQHWDMPDGQDVQVPDPVGFFQMINDFYTPPTKNQLSDQVSMVEVLNASGNENWDKVAADGLAWVGFQAQATGSTELAATTIIYDFTGGENPAAIAQIVKTLNVRPNQVISQPDPNRTVEFRVVLGSDYNSCSAPGFSR